MTQAPGLQGHNAGPVLSFASHQSSIKGEDIVLVRCEEQWPSSSAAASEAADLIKGEFKGLLEQCQSTASSSQQYLTYSLFIVNDGHNGSAAAVFVAEQLPLYLQPLLPAGGPPDSDAAQFTAWRHSIQRALTVALTLLHRSFAAKGILAGCTTTVALQAGWVLTVANLGDSRAVVDTGCDMVLLTEDHRVASHQAERRRLEAHGSVIAPVDISGDGPAIEKGSVGLGPLRLWPGGLCLSRAIGDFDVGEAVLALPYICQVQLPPTGARVIIASDGVWDAYEKTTRVASMARSWPTQTAPSKIVNSILRAHGGLKDDTSVVVLDVMPPNKAFAQCSGFSSSGCFCMKPSAQEEQSQPVEVLERLDVAAAAGCMAGAPTTAPPPWMTPAFVTSLLTIMEQAIDVWDQADEMRRGGKDPSIRHLPGLLAAANTAEALPAPATPEQLDACSLTADPDRPRLRRRSTDMPSPETQSKPHLENPSVRFGKATATPDDYARKFGAYSGQRRSMERPLSDGTPDAEGQPNWADNSVRVGRPPPATPSSSAFADYSVKVGIPKRSDVIAAANAELEASKRERSGSFSARARTGSGPGLRFHLPAPSGSHTFERLSTGSSAGGSVRSGSFGMVRANSGGLFDRLRKLSGGSPRSGTANAAPVIRVWGDTVKTGAIDDSAHHPSKAVFTPGLQHSASPAPPTALQQHLPAAKSADERVHGAANAAGKGTAAGGTADT